MSELVRRLKGCKGFSKETVECMNKYSYSGKTLWQEIAQLWFLMPNRMHESVMLYVLEKVIPLVHDLIANDKFTCRNIFMELWGGRNMMFDGVICALQKFGIMEKVLDQGNGILVGVDRMYHDVAWYMATHPDQEQYRLKTAYTGDVHLVFQLACSDAPLEQHTELIARFAAHTRHLPCTHIRFIVDKLVDTRPALYMAIARENPNHFYRHVGTLFYMDLKLNHRRYSTKRVRRHTELFSLVHQCLEPFLPYDFIAVEILTYV